jgi:hypothetical protein
MGPGMVSGEGEDKSRGSGLTVMGENLVVRLNILNRAKAHILLPEHKLDIVPAVVLRTTTTQSACILVRAITV